MQGSCSTVICVYVAGLALDRLHMWRSIWTLAATLSRWYSGGWFFGRSFSVVLGRTGADPCLLFAGLYSDALAFQRRRRRVFPLLPLPWYWRLIGRLLIAGGDLVYRVHLNASRVHSTRHRGLVDLRCLSVQGPCRGCCCPVSVLCTVGGNAGDALKDTRSCIQPCITGAE